MESRACASPAEINAPYKHSPFLNEHQNSPFAHACDVNEPQDFHVKGRIQNEMMLEFDPANKVGLLSQLGGTIMMVRRKL